MVEFRCCISDRRGVQSIQPLDIYIQQASRPYRSGFPTFRPKSLDPEDMCVSAPTPYENDLILLLVFSGCNSISVASRKTSKMRSESIPVLYCKYIRSILQVPVRDSFDCDHIKTFNSGSGGRGLSQTQVNSDRGWFCGLIIDQ